MTDKAPLTPRFWRAMTTSERILTAITVFLMLPLLPEITRGLAWLWNVIAP